ncbi:PREDICTED: dimethylaniline monooxygenase [N-oxide-forming] 5-like isoform X2 [Condylura cristata]|uniref:dimethylaniline monooxygenase [N-oxide-forming] 5-like isoform X2 n=1 Tax=Condylura cristata TaxID=143302 RepID=UPI00033438ED|nr:PREDICTED: dimethylaniline monooxygenase [N-oxide-forming] 5-like isoform X2 [Condylura cristata]
MPGKRIAVIGAGVSGLGAIKNCLEVGLEPTCFEGSDDIGGLWRYEEKTEGGRPSIYRSATSNTSKEMTAYSDYPFPAHFPNYMHNSKLMEYLRMYVRHFHLLKHIRFQTRVCSVRRRPDFSCTGQWDVVVETEGKQESHVFDGIMVCTGIYSEPVLPLESFPGIKRFKGEYIHSWEYKSPEKFQGKRIVVVGIGNSGVDVAIELSHVTSQMFLSTRTGSWVWNRVWDNGMPMDIALFTRFNSVLNKLYPAFLMNRWTESKLNARFNHDVYGLQPKHRFLNHQSTIGDDLPNHIISGRIVMKPNIKEFTETSVTFEDGTKEDIDVVIFATGYKFSFPFLESDSTVLDNQYTMFKFVFPPQLEKPTLAFIGILQPVGAVIPTSEIQSRWAAHVFKGLNKLPSVSDMMADITKKRKKNEAHFLNNPRDRLRVLYVDYMDDIASEIGVKPNLCSLLLWDPKLAVTSFFGPCTPYQYRLQGPGSWAGARGAIMTHRERIIKPLRTRSLACARPGHPVPGWLKSACVVLLVFVLTVVILKQ